MNVKKFLALKLAEIADAISKSADHLAENHSNDTVPDACAAELMVGVVKLAAVLKIAKTNGLIEVPEPSEILAVRTDTQSALLNEALHDALNGNLTGVLLV